MSLARSAASPSQLSRHRNESLPFLAPFGYVSYSGLSRAEPRDFKILTNTPPAEIPCFGWLVSSAVAARDDVPNARYWVGRGRPTRLLGRWAATVSWHKRWYGQKRAELARAQPVVSLAFNAVPVSSDHGLRTEAGDFSFDMCTFEHGPVQSGLSDVRIRATRALLILLAARLG